MRRELAMIFKREAWKFVEIF